MEANMKTRMEERREKREAEEENQFEIRMKIHSSEEFTVGEKRVIDWTRKRMGGFRTRLWSAIAAADADNLEKLRLGFPDDVSGFLSWHKGDLAERFRERGLEI